MAEVWYIEQQDGSIVGPIPERRICENLLAGKISPELRVRQGRSGPWCPASRARDLFRQLTETGWYIQSRGEVFGPFTPDRLLELHRAGEIASNANLRQGTQGAWKPAHGLFAVWTTKPQTPDARKSTSHNNARTHVETENYLAAHAHASSKWSVEPIRHYALPFEEANQSVLHRCLAHERLLLQPSDASDQLRVLRSNQQLVGVLSSSNSHQLLANQQRGIRHIALFSENPVVAEVIVILCPPGTRDQDSRKYIDAHFAPAERT